MCAYIYFTDEQKEQARRTDLVSLLRSQGEQLKRSGRGQYPAHVVRRLRYQQQLGRGTLQGPGQPDGYVRLRQPQGGICREKRNPGRHSTEVSSRLADTGSTGGR